MKSYCVKEKRKTMCVPGSEKIHTIKNGRRMSSCVCASCGITKTSFIKGQTGGAVRDFSCGYDLKGKRPGTLKECFDAGQIRRYGVEPADDLDVLIAGREYERLLKRRKPKVPSVWTPEKQKEYVDEIVADIKADTKRRKQGKKQVKWAPLKQVRNIPYGERGRFLLPTEKGREIQKKTL